MPTRERPLVSLLTDFGDRDPWAAICRGVVLSLAPEARLLDISHSVRKYDVREGAYLLWCALPYLPVGIHVGVVDPGVGTARRPVALLTDRGDILVGPDNGLLVPAAERLGGVREARLLENPAQRLAAVSASFHGRDVFAPVAGHLAAGEAFGSVGPVVAAGSLVPLAFAPATVDGGSISTAVLYVDTFGNVKLGAGRGETTLAFGEPPAGSLEVRAGDRDTFSAPWRSTFGDVAPGDAVVYLDSFDRLCLAVNQGSAADRFGLEEDVPVVVRRA
ncbi:MAG TPA: SAM-dependent chlorinase/fluorinase [Candidatus Dormibacteraeota bacterium]|nr:SAM-dependent chlorinase/fluorinase [Candidatus Dormibacteraeota bacterium]